MFLLELPHRGNSNEYTQHTIIIVKRKSPEISQNTILYVAVIFFCEGLKNKFETAVVNKLSVFKPLKFYCICILLFLV